METTTMNILEQLRWRYATKHFDATRKIPSETWAILEEVLRLAPSSFGLEPWRFLVISDPDLRQKLLAASWGQSQVVDSSHYVVFACKRNVGASDVLALIERTAAARGVSTESLKSYGDIITGFLNKFSTSLQVDEWATRQVYLALGTFLTAAAALGIDTCPMEGIDPAAYDEILGLNTQGYATQVACAAGFRSAEDKHARLSKVRKPLAEVVQVIG